MVGKIESRTFYPESGQVIFGAFVNGDYSKLISGDTRFWNASGIDLQVGADGFALRTGTLESLISGGVTFSEPDRDDKHSPTVPDGAASPSTTATPKPHGSRSTRLCLTCCFSPAACAG